MTISPEDPGLTPGSASPEGDAQPTPQSPEDIEAMWRNRFSQRDRAHNAEVESLRQQLLDLRNAPVATGEPTPETSYKARYEQTQQELQQERAARIVSERRAKFPSLAGEVGPGDPMWSQGNEESLARLNAMVGAPPRSAPTGHVDVNNPARTSAPPPADYGQMSKDQLLDELRRLSPVEAERMRAR